MKVTKQCSECGSREIYTNESRLGSYTQNLLPDITTFFDAAPEIDIYVCGECGHYQMFLQPRTLEKVKETYRRHR